MLVFHDNRLQLTIAHVLKFTKLYNVVIPRASKLKLEGNVVGEAPNARPEESLWYSRETRRC